MTVGMPITPLDAWIVKKTETSGDFVTREELSRYQLARLNETIACARSFSPFYQRHWAGGVPHSLSRLEELASYPLMTPADVGEYGLQMVCVSQGEINRVVTLATSGTTGNPKRLYFTATDQELTIDFFRCGMSTLVGPGDRVLILLPGERPGSVGDLLGKGLLRSGVLPAHYGLVRNIPDAVTKMCKEQATCLVGVPVQILAMARYWEQWGKSTWAPSCALVSTDYIPVAIVRELKRIWNCEVFEHYGMTEMGLGGGLECAAHNGYHMREADLYIEIIDPVSAQPLPEGEYGEVVFTTLTRRGMPLIRYRTGDISRVIPGQCLCGSRLRRLERVQSRITGRVCLGDGKWLTIAELDEVLFPVTGIINFSAAISYIDSLIRLQVIAYVLGPVPEKSVILSALRQISSIRAAETTGQVILAAAVVSYEDGFVIDPGKRIINISGRRESTVGSGDTI
ncbi:DVU_1553 family AMP-dependent CoA ligase [Sporomusa sp.]|uniref:DVU_1553 family AMP-dependent CoA ligase n=1 Tax=Sporomusa sp. TaxID=2078658 RepID=UPI002BB6B139|nr:AMP-binding protein [Sporomusa sp.]HWR41703.1 AMP-binding protein [Sporomusa sp.]